MLGEFDRLLNEMLRYAVATLVVAILLVVFIRRETLLAHFDMRVRWTFNRCASGIIFGRLLPIRFPWSLMLCSDMEKDGHVLCLGGTGDGKTSALLIPSIQSTKKTSTFFAYDISGDITRVCGDENTLLLAPTPLAEAPEHKSSYWNVFWEADTAQSEEARVEALKRLAYILMPDVPMTSDAGLYYLKNGRKMLIGALLAYHAKGYDFCGICTEILSLSTSVLLNKIDTMGCEAADMYISSFLGTSEKAIAGCRQTMCEAIDLFGSTMSVKRILHRGDHAIHASMIETKNVIFGVNKADKDLYKPLTRLITAQVLSYLNRRQGRGKKNILFCLDEFAEIGKIDGIQGALAGLRKNGVRIILLTQSLAQVDELYGRVVRLQMMDNLRYVQILSVSSPEEQLYFAERIGKKEIRNRETGTITETWRIRPEKLGRLGNKCVVITPYGYKKIRKNYYWRWWK